MDDLYNRALNWWSELSGSEQKHFSRRYNYGDLTDISHGNIIGEDIAIMFYFESATKADSYEEMMSYTFAN